MGCAQLLSAPSGDSIEIPGTSVEIVRVLDELNVTSGSETGILHINDTSVVSIRPCSLSICHKILQEPCQIC